MCRHPSSLAVAIALAAGIPAVAQSQGHDERFNLGEIVVTGSRPDGLASVEAFVVRHGRDGAPSDATALVRLEDGMRALAAIEATPSELVAMEAVELVGVRGRIRHDAVSRLNRIRLG